MCIVPTCSADSRGFALMELLLAVAILAAGCLLLFSVQATNADRAAEARFQTRAALLARHKLTACRLQPFDQVADEAGDFGPESPDLLWEQGVHELGPEESGLAGSAGWLKLVELRVRPRGGRQPLFTVRTVLMRHPDSETQETAP
ncbi:hypothetical protein CAY53_06420 [Desulfobulbus oralis]|uniref:Type II secretion system protein GspI C-terminal domain-containing protein n=1 Tax=Desulfobulbus oralis TaxID=1986146 RepID=A0A2L1GNF8_9BACT|nr:hypothetical protein CAY53_06420 [Desulfobulbus oralis]